MGALVYFLRCTCMHMYVYLCAFMCMCVGVCARAYVVATDMSVPTVCLHHTCVVQVVRLMVNLKMSS